MHFSGLFLCCSVFVINLHLGIIAAVETSEVEGYYWRDYTGVIPKDALAGGKNANGKTTYIGQILHQDQIIPAKIDPDEGKVTYEWGYKEYVAYINIKILCTRHPEQFEWVDTGNKHIDTIKDKHFIVGGYESGVTALYIGRKQLEDELAVGKVIFGDLQSTLNTTKDGIGTQHATFQVLAYSPNTKSTKKKEEIPSAIDTRIDTTSTSNESKDPDCDKINKTIIINFYN